MKIEEDKICIQLKDEHGNVFLFKPYPPYVISYSNIHHSFGTIDDIKLCHFALGKIIEFVDK